MGTFAKLAWQNCSLHPAARVGNLLLNVVAAAPGKAPSFHVIALAERGGIHKPFVDAAKIWLGKLASDNNFTVDYIEDTEKIDEAFLAKYDLFIQLNYPPYNVDGDREGCVHPVH